MIKFNVGAINCCTEIEGPNKRLSIWFQGCTLNCKGCCNPELQALKFANLLSLDELIEIIKDSINKYDIEGVTYLGGEPTLQQYLPSLTKKIHELGLGVISFTGRIYEDVKDVLEGCDLVIDGPYIENKKDNNRKLIGSSNQRIIVLSDRYKNYEEWFMDTLKQMEINIKENIILNGDPIFNKKA